MGETRGMKLNAASIALAVITGVVAALLGITLSLLRNGRVDVPYVILLAVVGFVGSLIWSFFAGRNRPKP